MRFVWVLIFLAGLLLAQRNSGELRILVVDPAGHCKPVDAHCCPHCGRSLNATSEPANQPLQKQSGSTPLWYILPLLAFLLFALFKWHNGRERQERMHDALQGVPSESSSPVRSRP